MKKPSKAEVSLIALKAYNLLREEDAIIGHLTDFKVKWLVGFCNHIFGTDRSKIAIDFHSKPRRIFLMPLHRKNDEYVSFSSNLWSKLNKTLNIKAYERDLPSHVGVEEFAVKFVRELPDEQ